MNTTLYSHLTARMILRNIIWEDGVLECCEPRTVIHFFHSANKPLFFYSSFSSNHPGAKYLQYSAKQHRQPLSFLLPDIYSMPRLKDSCNKMI